MSYIAARNVCRLGVLIAAHLANQTCAAAPNTILAPVASMYRSFAWEALSDDSDLFGKGLASQPASMLTQYFDARLSKMIADDAACQRRTQSFCKIDFDILFDSQDPRIADLTIATGASSTVDVRFKDPVTEKETLITYTLAHQSNGWRISDVAYTHNGRRTLRALLLAPINLRKSEQSK